MNRGIKDDNDKMDEEVIRIMKEMNTESEQRPAGKRDVLNIPQNEAIELIKKQLINGNDVDVRYRIMKKRGLSGLTKHELDEYRKHLNYWDRHNTDLLNIVFIDRSLFHEYT